MLNNNSQDYGQRYLVRSETQATLNHILKNASLAVGYGALAGNNEGIIIGATNASLGDTNSFCIHQPNGNGNNLINYTGGDIWLCYSWSGNQINWCAETYSGPGTDPRALPAAALQVIFFQA